MKMDRNQSEGGTCKYAAINLRKLKSCRSGTDHPLCKRPD